MSAVIEISIPKNRIYIGLEGFFQEDEAAQVADRMIRELKRLRSGFDLINDISQFKPASAASAAHILRVQGVMKDMGVRRIVRVVAGNALGNMQLKRAANESGLDAEITSSRAEADRLLDKAA